MARTLHKRGVDMGRRSQFEALPLEEYIADRARASKPRKDENWPEWAIEDVLSKVPKVPKVSKVVSV